MGLGPVGSGKNCSRGSGRGGGSRSRGRNGSSGAGGPKGRGRGRNRGLDGGKESGGGGGGYRGRGWQGRGVVGVQGKSVEGHRDHGLLEFPQDLASGGGVAGDKSGDLITVAPLAAAQGGGVVFPRAAAAHAGALQECLELAHGTHARSR